MSICIPALACFDDHGLRPASCMLALIIMVSHNNDLVYEKACTQLETAGQVKGHHSESCPSNTALVGIQKRQYLCSCSEGLVITQMKQLTKTVTHH